MPAKLRMRICRFAFWIRMPGMTFCGNSRICVALKGLLIIMLCGAVSCCSLPWEHWVGDPACPPEPSFISTQGQQGSHKTIYSEAEFNGDWGKYQQDCPALLDSQCAAQPPDSRCEKCKVIRNRIVQGTILQINENFRQFADLFWAGRGGYETITDVAVLGLNAAGTLAGGEAIKAILAAASGGLTGTRLSVNQNIFKQQATDIFISQMETLRTQKREEIKGKLDKSITGYSLYEAFDDLLAYYDAGTTRAAYQTLQKGTAKAVPGAPTKVEAKPGKEEGTATVTFMPPDSNGGSPITGYTVTSHPAGGKDEDAGKTSTTHTVSELKSKAYTFTVTATNAAGTSAASAPSSSITPTSASAPPATKVPPATNASLAAKASTETPPTKTDDKTRLRQFLRQTGGADEIMECWKYENPALFKEGSDLPCAGGTPSAARLINAPECAGDQAKVRACLESRKK